MSRIINSFIIILLLFFLPLRAIAEKITYKNVLNQAIDNSYDLKTSTFDVGISKANFKGAKSELMPQLKAQTYSEHIKDLANSSSYAAVGNTMVPPNTRYQNMATLGLAYNLFDFGAVKNKVLITEKIVEQKEVMCEIQTKDLKMKILDLYTKILLYNKEINSKTKILKIYEELFAVREQLYEAGTSSKIVVMDEAVKMVKVMDDIESSKTQLKSALKDLCLYTKQDYSIEDLDVEDFEAHDDNSLPENTDTVEDGNVVLVGNVHQSIHMALTEEVKLFDPTKMPESRYYNLEIQKKKAELEIYKSARLPAFKFYTNYSFYGQDMNKYAPSLTSMSQRNLSMGVMSSLPIFDGFKNKSDRDRASLEIQKLQLQKDKKLQELENEYNKTYTDYFSYIEELKIKQAILNTVQEKLSAIERLADNGMSPRQDILAQEAELLTQEIDVRKNIITISSKLKEINIMLGEE